MQLFFLLICYCWLPLTFAACSTSYGSIVNSTLVVTKNVTKIDRDAFLNCSELRYVDLSNSQVEVIDDYAFSMSGLMSIDLTSSVTTIGQYAFSKCQNLTYVNMRGSGVESIADYAFSETGLEKIDFNEGLKSIGAASFRGCTHPNLTIYIPYNVTKISTDAFESTVRIVTSACSGVPTSGKVTFTSNVTSVLPYAYFRCEELSSVVLSTAVGSIGERAFYESSLSIIEFEEGTSRLASIGTEAFMLSNLVEMQLSGSTTQNQPKIISITGCSSSLGQGCNRAGGDEISIEGVNFGVPTEFKAVVLVNGFTCDVTEQSDTEIACILPENPGGVAPVVVVIGSQTTNIYGDLSYEACAPGMYASSDFEHRFPTSWTSIALCLSR